MILRTVYTVNAAETSGMYLVVATALQKALLTKGNIATPRLLFAPEVPD